MKVRAYTWEEFKKLNPKQTAVIVSYKGKGVDKQRIFVGNWMSREEAWNWCKANNVKWGVIYTRAQEAIQKEVKLLRLSKVIADLAVRQPKNVSAYLPKV